MLIEEQIEQAVSAIKQGKLAVIPTDTLYGIAADPNNDKAVSRLIATKKRDADKPIALLAADIESVVAFGAVMNEQELALAKAFWPGALTLVLNVEDGEPEGFRIPDLEVSRAILKRCGGVLRVSSANLSGEAAALTAEAAAEALASEDIAVIVDAGPVKGGVASTVACAASGELKIFREGAISSAELIKAVNNA
ncbi:MAG: threonylcarbamoyl-AMP synthase [Kiritimatiellae bacterium]|nr:threonylcarbamoyl-AMP synthase [Kiritimatiellia bacterium]